MDDTERRDGIVVAVMAVYVVGILVIGLLCRWLGG